MTTAENVQTLQLEAGAAVSIYRFVTVAADGQADHTGADLRADAVSAEAAAAVGDQFAAAQLQGKMKLEAGAAVTRGALVGSDAAGKAVAAGTTVNNYSLGVAMEAAGADGDIIQVLLHSPDRHGGT